jgi:hypothetical protein
MMTGSELLDRISAQDWEATPDSVRKLLLSLLPLAKEVTVLRARLRLAQRDPTNDLEGADDAVQGRRVERYRLLVDRLFLDGPSAEEQQELERLGAEIDAYNAPFYEAALRRMEAVGRRQE